jgi:hypothetical protein
MTFGEHFRHGIMKQDKEVAQFAPPPLRRGRQWETHMTGSDTEKDKKKEVTN